jgi:putative ABC transport system ATP-binding protein
VNNKNQKPIIQLENVSFVYNAGKPTESYALKDISLEIYPGEYASFLGPSGCGKSTLLYAIAGIEKPTSGRVLINGRDITQMSSKELAIYRQVGIGIIFQNFNLIPSISVRDNIIMPMAFLGVSSEIREKQADEILKRLDLGKLGKRFPYELSGGQQQRVGIARALVNEPPLMLADEPLGNLDSKNANNVLEFLKELNQKYKKTIIMVTHEAWSLRDVTKVFHMLDGKITGVEDKVAGTMITMKGKGEGETPTVSQPKYSMEDRAKSISSLLLRGYSNAELVRFEGFLIQLLKKEIALEEFIHKLNTPFKDGGVGLWKQKAERLGKLVEEAIVEEKNLEKIYEMISRNVEITLYDEVREIRNWLLEGFKIKIDSLQYIQLDEIIGERIRGIVDSSHFLKIMGLAKSKGGLGFTSRTSLKLTEKFESLLGGKLTIPIN